ncbi:transcription initiation factor TFIID subunit 9 [Podospora didyma]|uniref:Transcription initiation factor TFIID subunit 9 n=1 Tax=Podospora didyma TaxID=330526 RepID=A0AAE0P6S2_9PEZI|nr:transcription initiation factor TFIID subunit 9 [Podospora didyma]
MSSSAGGAGAAPPSSSAPQQPNGVPSSSAASNSQTLSGGSSTQQQPPTSSQPATQGTTQSQPGQATQSSTSQTTQPPSQPLANQLLDRQPLGPASPSANAPRPRDARTIELLLTAQGVTAYEQRVPLLLLDFAYRHTSAILSDALHLSADPYTSHAGARPSAASGAAPVNVGDATVTANAIQLAISSRLGFQFRGGGGGGIGPGASAGGTAKDWLMDMAREQNKIALPRISASEWGVRLPSERFVLSGLGWGLRDVWAGQEGADDDSDEDEEFEDVGGLGGAAGGGDRMEGIETEDIGGDGVEGGTVDDIFGDAGMDEDDEDAEMVEA